MPRLRPWELNAEQLREEAEALRAALDAADGEDAPLLALMLTPPDAARAALLRHVHETHGPAEYKYSLEATAERADMPWPEPDGSEGE